MPNFAASVPLGQRALIHTHELMTMSDREAREKWERLAEASGVDLILAHKLAITLVICGALGGGPDLLIRALDHIKQAKYSDDLEREKVLKFVEDTVVPSNMPSDDSRFSLLSLPFSHSDELLKIHAIFVPNMTLDKLMHSPCTIQLALDDEMQAFAKKRFNDYWKFIAKGPWANDIVRDHIYEKHSVYRYPLPTFSNHGDEEEFGSGPYSRSDIQKWLDSEALLNLRSRAMLNFFANRAILDSNNRAMPQDQLLDMFGSLSLNTDGDNGDNGGSMDAS